MPSYNHIDADTSTRFYIVTRILKYYRAMFVSVHHSCRLSGINLKKIKITRF